MHIEQISGDILHHLEPLGMESTGMKILHAKSRLIKVKIVQLHVGAANILKQDALSVGADVAVPRTTILGHPSHVDAILVGTPRMLERLIFKLKAQPFGLKIVAQELATLLHPIHHRVSVMGIVNANADSFYPQSRFVADTALAHIEEMIAAGAHIIDVGGVSSRPGSEAIDADEELARVGPIIDLIDAHRLHEQVRFSLDSYAPSVIEYALDRGFEIINDITGLADDRVAQLCGAYGAHVVIMHMQGDPKTMQEAPHYTSVIHEVERFFQERIAKAHAFGIEKIILDTGIGFGKTLEHNLALIAHQRHFTRLGYPLLVGASRKSLIGTLTGATVSERLAGTLALHLRAIEEGASIIRVHDVPEHVQALKMWQALQGV